jgi:2,4-dienoyl-CoA reductase-like NADH-dependent reductase (Old Yellow Enzyme family)
MDGKININLAQFMIDRAKGIAKIVKLNGVPHYTARRFDEATGEPVPALHALNEADVQATIAQFEQAAAAAKQLLADIQSAEEKLAAK